MKVTFAYLAGYIFIATGFLFGSKRPPPSFASRPMAVEFDSLGKKFPVFHQASDMDPATYDYKQMYGAGIDSHRRFSPMCFVDGMYHKPAWIRFHDSVVNFNDLRKNKMPLEEFKIIMFQRHGQGWHNVAEEKYGTPAWNCYWAQQDGDADMRWSDADLSPQGQQECFKLNEWYKTWFGNPDNRTQYIKETLGVPMFQSYYVSPLSRAIETANMAFGGIDFPRRRQYRPIVKEMLREDISTHTCDRRSTKSEIAAKFPNVVFEDGFTEEDELWRPDIGETRKEGETRARAVLEDIFRNDSATWISITTHSGMIRNMLSVLNHRPFPLKTGQILPVYVKATLKFAKTEGEQLAHEAGFLQNLEELEKERVEDENARQKMEDEAWSKYTSAVAEAGGTEPERPKTTTWGKEVKGEKTCASLPVVTSIEGKGCICATSPTTTTSTGKASSTVDQGARFSPDTKSSPEPTQSSESK